MAVVLTIAARLQTTPALSPSCFEELMDGHISSKDENYSL
jgi:hypothetical protein